MFSHNMSKVYIEKMWKQERIFIDINIKIIEFYHHVIIYLYYFMQL